MVASSVDKRAEQLKRRASASPALSLSITQHTEKGKEKLNVDRSHNQATHRSQSQASLSSSSASNTAPGRKSTNGSTSTTASHTSSKPSTRQSSRFNVNPSSINSVDELDALASGTGTPSVARAARQSRGKSLPGKPGNTQLSTGTRAFSKVVASNKSTSQQSKNSQVQTVLQQQKRKAEDDKLRRIQRAEEEKQQQQTNKTQPSLSRLSRSNSKTATPQLQDDEDEDDDDDDVDMATDNEVAEHETTSKQRTSASNKKRKHESDMHNDSAVKQGLKRRHPSSSASSSESKARQHLNDIPTEEGIFDEAFDDPYHLEFTHRHGVYCVNSNDSQPTPYHTTNLKDALKHAPHQHSNKNEDGMIYYIPGTSYESLRNEDPSHVHHRYDAATTNVGIVEDVITSVIHKVNRKAFQEVKMFIHQCYRNDFQSIRYSNRMSIDALENSVIGATQLMSQLPVGILVTGINVSDNELLLHQQQEVLRMSVTNNKNIPSDYMPPIVARIGSNMIGKTMHHDLGVILHRFMAAYTPKSINFNTLTRTGSQALQQPISRTCSAIINKSATSSASVKDKRDVYQLFDGWYKKCQAVAQSQLDERKVEAKSKNAADADTRNSKNKGNKHTTVNSDEDTDDDGNDVQMSESSSYETLEPKLVIMIEDTEIFNTQRLNSLVRLFMSHPQLKNKPFVLLLTLAGSDTAVHTMLETSILDRLWIRTFSYGFNQRYMDMLGNQLFLKQELQLSLSPSVLEFIQTYSHHDNSSLQWLQHVLSNIIHHHYSTQVYSHLVLTTTEKLSDAINDHDLTMFQELPSVVSESRKKDVTKQQVVQWIIDIVNYKKHYITAVEILQTAMELREDLKSLSVYKLICILAAEGERRELRAVYNTLQSQKPHKIRELIHDWLVALKDSKNSETSSTSTYFGEEIADLQEMVDLIELSVSNTASKMLNSDDDLLSSTMNVNNNRKGRSDSSSHSANVDQATVNSAASRRSLKGNRRSEAILAQARSTQAAKQEHGAKAASWLMGFIEKHLKTVTSFPAHELFYYQNQHILHSMFQAQPSNVVLNSLLTSSPYLKMKDTPRKTTTKKSMHMDMNDPYWSQPYTGRIPSINDELEDIQIMYQLYNEQGNTINLLSWYNAFKSCTTKLPPIIIDGLEDEDDDTSARRRSKRRRHTVDSSSAKKMTIVDTASASDRARENDELQTRFMNALSIMKNLGFIKAARKVDHVTKLIF